MKTGQTASVRIHVERAINRIKTYRIFKQALPIKSKKTISTVIFVCAGLCKLKNELKKSLLESLRKSDVFFGSLLPSVFVCTPDLAVEWHVAT